MKVLIGCGLILAISTAQAQTGYQFRAVDFPGSANTAIYAVNDRGEFVGAEKDINGAHHAIFDNGRHLALLDAAGLIGTSPESWAFSINDLGDIAGTYTDTSGTFHGYVHHADRTITHIEFPNATGTKAYGVNDRGTVIGVYIDTDGNTRSFMLRKGRYRNMDLPGGTPSFGTTPLSVNDSDVIVGELTRTDGTNGCG